MLEVRNILLVVLVIRVDPNNFLGLVEVRPFLSGPNSCLKPVITRALRKQHINCILSLLSKSLGSILPELLSLVTGDLSLLQHLGGPLHVMESISQDLVAVEVVAFRNRLPGKSLVGLRLLAFVGAGVEDGSAIFEVQLLLYFSDGGDFTLIWVCWLCRVLGWPFCRAPRLGGHYVCRRGRWGLVRRWPGPAGQRGEGPVGGRKDCLQRASY